MENRILELASSQGIWVVLSFFLILYTIKQQEKRDIQQEKKELKYQSIIEDLTAALQKLETIEETIENIKKKILD